MSIVSKEIDSLPDTTARSAARVTNVTTTPRAPSLATRAATADDPGDPGGIAELPSAAAATLAEVRHAGIDLADLARLEAMILARLPHAMLRPADPVARAVGRIGHAPAVLGPVERRSLSDLAPHAGIRTCTNAPSPEPCNKLGLRG